MNLVLTHCWKEWRAQRVTLLAYTGLIFTCLWLALYLAPATWWQQKHLAVHALGSCFLAGVLGVAVFIAPRLVRAEFTTQDDQFIRRLPGALPLAFAGKLLFLLLASLALPFLGLLLGEAFALCFGADWNGLFEVSTWGEVRWTQQGGEYLRAGIAGLLLLPWIWAVGTWMPKGRMAVGGTVLFALLVAVALGAVFRQSPGLDASLSPTPWLWALAPTGLLVAAVSWIVGRRGGDSRRSTRFGLLTTAIAFAVPAAWLGHRAWDYHHPNLQQLTKLTVKGLSPDGHFALATGAAHEAFAPVPIRIDLQTGQAEQLAGIWTVPSSTLMRPCRSVLAGTQRHWTLHDVDAEQRQVIDLVTGRRTAIGYHLLHRRELPPEELLPAVLLDTRRTLGLQAPGGLQVWFEQNQLCREIAGGGIQRTPWPDRGTGFVRPCGHGFQLDGQTFDLTGARLSIRHGSTVWIVREQILSVPDGRSSAPWQQRSIRGEDRDCEALTGARVHGLFDDDHLLCMRQRELFLYRPADGEVTPIPSTLTAFGRGWTNVEPRLQLGTTVLPRDSNGRIWLRAWDAGRNRFLAIDTATRTVVRDFTRPFDHVRREFEILDLADGERILARDGASIVRLDAATGQTATLFPRR